MAAVDVADCAVVPHRFVARDRLVGEVRRVPRQVQVGAEAAVGLAVVAVGEDRRRIEPGHEAVGAERDYVGAEQAGRAVQGAAVHVEEGVEGIAGLVEQLHPCGPVVVAFQMSIADRVQRRIHPVVPVLKLRGSAKRQLIVDGKVENAFDIGRVVSTVREAGVARELTDHGFRGFELDHAGGRIAPEEGPLRPAQDFDVRLVEHREALECRKLLDDVIVVKAHGL